MTDQEQLHALVELAVAGDTVAFGRLVDLTAAMVRGVARREIEDPAMAEDAVQDTYLRAFRRLPALRDRRAFPGWLKRIAVSVARDTARRKRFVFVDPVRLDRRVVAAPGDDGAVAALDQALAVLTPEDRCLVERYYRGGWTTARLARDAGVSEPAIRKRLQRTRDTMRRKMTTTCEQDDLPERIAELLARPLLIDRPENPVGAVWNEIRESRSGDEVIHLPERILWPDVEALFGAEAAAEIQDPTFRADDETILRFDQTVPMLLAAKGRPAGARLLSAGKVYRDVPEDRTHMLAFHQAEALWIGEGLTAWNLMDWIEPLFETLLPGARLRIDPADYPRYATRGHEIQVRFEGDWTEVGGFARFSDDLVRGLGHDPGAVAAVGAGLGLERIACLRYGIDDVRRVSARRLSP